jgi:hypothetical protein
MPSTMLERKTTGHYGRLVLGWTLLVVGVAALVLPGPGLLLIAAGLTVLSQQYLWARRRLRPVRERAFELARFSVRSWVSILVAVVLALVPIGLGMAWAWQPPVPSWWPLAERWWLPGGVGTASSLVGSGALALGLLTYSYGRFGRGQGQGQRDAQASERA